MTVGQEPALVAAYFAMLGVLGLLIGSFLNVVIYRVPAGLSIIRPGSSCPSCHTPISPRDNIPVVSWLLLRGRCRSCRAAISVRYPLVELATALLWLGLGWWALGAAEPPGGIDPLLPLLLVLGSAGIALAMIDVDHHRLPDAIVLPLYPVTAAGLALAGLISGEWPVLRALAGGGLWVLVIGGIWLATAGRGMGFGDVKLAPVLGVTLGWVAFGAALVGLFTAFLLGAVVGVLLMVLGRAGRRSQVPFGPFLLAGAAVGLLVGQAVAEAYLSWVSS